MSLTVTADTPATASQFNSLIPYFAQQSSDQTLNTTTFTDHVTFTAITVGAGETWEYTINLVIGDSTVASGLRTRLEVTGTVTTGYRHILGMGATATTANDATNFDGQARNTTTTVTHGVTASASVYATVQEKFLVIGGASGGTFGLEWSCAAMSGNVTVKAGGHIIGHRVV
ncbi:MAG: hypothetical protein M3N43_06495 [Actinomycetota bacterium]|nr:hypothetical protein [Actinomycetota bacterium]